MSDPIQIPSDVDRPDAVMAGLTVRQVLILAGSGGLVWLVYLLASPLLPVEAVAALAVLIACAGIVLALGRRDGLSADRLLAAAFSWWRRPRRTVLAPDGLPPVPSSLAAEGHRRQVGVLQLPVRTVAGDGVLESGDHGLAVIAEASTVSFALRAPHEQQALLGCFARWLNSIDDPVQILIRSQWVDLEPLIAAIEQIAPRLPHPALEEAAYDHVEFLAALAETNWLKRRQVLLVFRDARPGRDRQGAAQRLHRRVDAARGALSGADISLTVLDGGQAAAVLATCSNPLGPGRDISGWASPEAVIEAMS